MKIQSLNPRFRLLKYCIPCISILLLMIGCSHEVETQFNPNWKLDEHGNPEFKPENFQDAIAKLRTDFDLINKTSSAQKQDLLQVYQQIVRWLPEFAADTDIRRKDWESLDNLSMNLLKDTFTPDFFTEKNKPRIESTLDQLSSMIPPDKNQSKQTATTK